MFRVGNFTIQYIVYQNMSILVHIIIYTAQDFIHVLYMYF